MQTVLVLGPSPASDEPGRSLEPALEEAGYKLRRIAKASELTDLGAAEAAVAVLIDATSAGADGGTPTLSDAESECARARDALGATELPVLVLLGRDALADPGLPASLGGRFCPDDFIVWPVEPAELSARIRLARLRVAPGLGSDAVVIGDLVIDPGTYEVSLHGARLNLTFKEYELLKHLAGNRGQVFTREMLLRDIWGYDYYGGTRTVDVHVRRIRMKLGLKYGSLVETVRNVGYRFSKEVPAQM